MTRCPPRYDKMKAEPNLTPLLDVVFQLITFFMLVINFSSENYDQRVRLPVADSARPIDEPEQVSEDRLVLNVDSEGHLLIAGRGSAFAQGPPDDQAPGRPGQAQPQSRGHEGRCFRRPADGHHLPRRQDATFGTVIPPDQGLPVERVPEVRIEGDECTIGSCLSPCRRTGLVGTQEHSEIRRARGPRSRRCWTWRSSS